VADVTTTTSTLIWYRVRRTDRRLAVVFDRLLVKLVYDTRLWTFVDFEPMTFWCILFILSMLISLNLIDINVCKVIILREMRYFCV